MQTSVDDGKGKLGSCMYSDKTVFKTSPKGYHPTQPITGNYVYGYLVTMITNPTTVYFF